MTQAMIAFGQLINKFIELNAELSVQLANFQNAINQGIPGKIQAAEKSSGVADFIGKLNDPSFTMSSTQASEVQVFSAEQNAIMSQGQAETQGVQTTLTGSTNAIQALQQSLNEFTSEGGSTIDSTLPNNRIQ
jgi:hypothetical protein